MVQVPTATSVKVVPLTVHTAGVVDEKATGKPEVAVADRVGGGLPRVWFPGPANEMVWAAAATVTDCMTASAAAYSALPGWLAAVVQTPALTRVRVAPLTVQMLGVKEVNVTARPDVDVAVKGAGAEPRVWLPGEG